MLKVILRAGRHVDQPTTLKELKQGFSYNMRWFKIVALLSRRWIPSIHEV